MRKTDEKSQTPTKVTQWSHQRKKIILNKKKQARDKKNKQESQRKRSQK